MISIFILQNHKKYVVMTKIMANARICLSITADYVCSLACCKRQRISLSPARMDAYFYLPLGSCRLWLRAPASANIVFFARAHGRSLLSAVRLCSLYLVAVAEFVNAYERTLLSVA